MNTFYYRQPEQGRFPELRVGRVALTVVAAIVALVLFVMTIVMWPFAKVGRQEIALSYGGGLVEGAKFQGVKEPGSGLFANGWGDKLYRYPVTQRNYIISTRQGEGDVGRADSVQAVTKDNVAVHFEIAVYFKLNTNNHKLRQFHEDIGLKYQAWKEGGWDKMLNDSFRQQIENSLQEEARAVEVAELYSDQSTLLSIQETVGAVLRDRVADSLGGDYFCGPTFVRGRAHCPEFSFIIKKLTIPERVKDAFEKNRTSLIEVQTKQNEIAQRTAEAQAIRELNAALATAGDQYVQLKQIEALTEAIKSGQIKFWVIPSDAGLTIPAQP